MASVELAFTAWGDSSLPAVLLIHGVAGCGRIWQPVASALADRYHLVAPDLPGHGTSPRTGSYSLEAYSAEIDAFVAARELASLTLIGHSFGAILCADHALRHAQQVRALVLIDINFPPPAWQIEHLRAAAEKPAPVFATREAGIDYLRRSYAPAGTPKVLHDLAECLLAGDPGGLTLQFDRETLRQAAPLNVADQLSHLTCPTMFLRGSDSKVMDRAGAISLLHQVEQSRLVQIPRAGHHVFLDNPAATTHELRLFLDGVHQHA
jgi:pimeloyl-ACP methyl ester carboxylesterase